MCPDKLYDWNVGLIKQRQENSKTFNAAEEGVMAKVLMQMRFHAAFQDRRTKEHRKFTNIQL
jgi:hypothetical protein